MPATLPSAEFSEMFLLAPDVTFINHSSFGATPMAVFEVYQGWQRRLERQPDSSGTTSPAFSASLEANLPLT